jgi:hypothetical protein
MNSFARGRATVKDFEIRETFPFALVARRRTHDDVEAACCVAASLVPEPPALYRIRISPDNCRCCHTKLLALACYWEEYCLKLSRRA